MDQLAVKAFQSLTNICNTTALHPNDEDRIKVTLKALHKNGVVINIAALENWLLNNSWQTKPIKSVTAWASEVATGGRVQLNNKQIAPTEKQVWERLNV